MGRCHTRRVGDALRGTWQRAGRTARRVVVSVIGIAVILAGAAMLVLPGPGIATVIGGLAILATEFTWAKRVLRWARAKWDNARDDIKYRYEQRRAAAGPDTPDTPDTPGSAAPGDGSAEEAE